MPRIVPDWVRKDPDALFQEYEGSLVFVDISGFTKMSERLARNGRVGAEEVTEVIGSVFARLLVVAYENGASLLKFGGDALLLLFTGELHEARAVLSAYGMRRHLRDAGKIKTTAGMVTLRMSVGVNSGVVQMFLVGNTHRELIIAGPTVTGTVSMENTAEAGDILLGPSTAAALPDSVLGAPKGPGILLRRQPPAVPPHPADMETRPDIEGVGRYVPSELRRYLRSGHLEPQHRQLSIGFLHFDGTDELVTEHGVAATAKALEDLVTKTQAAVDEHRVTFLGTDVDKDGGKIILISGAPDAHGDNEERLLMAATAIRDSKPALPVRIGVNTGPVFVGDVGPHYRKTFTVMGDAVNLAARVMSKASPGQVLATDSTIELSRVLFNTDPLPPFLVKGKKLPIKASEVGKAIGSNTMALDEAIAGFYGRVEEMKKLMDLSELVWDGKGSLVEVIGEAGIGKSRLLREFSAEVDMANMTVACEPYETDVPYAAFRSSFRWLLGIPQDAASSTAARLLRARVTATRPSSLPWLPLIAAPLGVIIPDTPEVAALDPRFRSNRIHAEICGLLQVCVTSPALLVYEDAHWMDEASAQLLQALADNIETIPLMICVPWRNDDEALAQGHKELRLGPLNPDETRDLIMEATADDPIPEHSVETLMARSGGNTRYLKWMLYTIRELGTTVDELPATIEGLAMAQVDRLNYQDRLWVRHLSVLGMGFTLEQAADILELEDLRKTRKVLRSLGAFIASQKQGGYRFRNALAREVTYNSLPFKLRKELHLLAGETIEKRAGERTDEVAALLSFHFFHAKEYEHAWQYSRSAGEQALRIFANAEARDLFVRALKAARFLPNVTKDEIASVSSQLGDVYVRLGELRQARRAYLAARKATADPISAAELALKEASALNREGRYSLALRSLTQGAALLSQKGVSQDDPQVVGLRARFAADRADIRVDQGRYVEALTLCEQAVADAEQVGHFAAMAHAYYVMDGALAYSGRAAEAVNSTVALQIYRRLGDVPMQANAANNIGTCAFLAGDWVKSIDWYRKAGEMFEQTGDVVMQAATRASIGETLLGQGKYGEAERQLLSASRVFTAAGARLWGAYADMVLGAVASRCGRFDEAAQKFGKAIEAYSRGDDEQLADTAALSTEMLMLRGDSAAAIAVCDKLMSQKGGNSRAAMLLRVRGYANAQLGNQESAAKDLEASLFEAELAASNHDIVFTLHALEHVGEKLSPAKRKQKADLMKQMDIVHLAPPVAAATE